MDAKYIKVGKFTFRDREYYLYRLSTEKPPMIDREQVRHVANLGRLQLSEAEEIAFTSQLGDILDYFEQLSELDPLLQGVEPTARAIATVNVTRPDTPKPYEDKEALLNGAPEREDDFFRVPQIMG